MNSLSDARISGQIFSDNEGRLEDSGIDCIIFDSIPKYREGLDIQLPVYGFGDFQFDFSYGGSMHQVIDNAMNPCIVLQYCTITDIELLLQDENLGCTVINLYSGVGSIGKKISFDFDYIRTCMELGLPCFVPFSFASLLSCFHKKDFVQKAIFLQNTVSYDVLDDNDKDFLSLKTGQESSFCLLADTGNIQAVLQLQTMLEQSGYGSDVFLVKNRLSIEKLSLDGYMKVYVFCDWGNNKNEQQLHTEYFIQHFGLKKSTIQFFGPRYDTCTTFFDEYILEDLKYDFNGLLETISQSSQKSV